MKSKKKEIASVILLASQLDGGGAEKSMRRLNDALNESGHRSIFVGINSNNRDLPRNKSELLIARKHRGGPMNTLFAWCRFQALYINSSSVALVANCDLAEFFAATLLFPSKLIVVEHSTHPWETRKALGNLVRLLLRIRKAHFVSVSASVPIWHNNSRPRHVIENLIHAPVGGQEGRNSKNREKRLLFIGRLSAEKNPLSFLRVVSILNISAVMVGDGPLKQEVKSYIKKNILDVELRGYQSDPWLDIDSSFALLVTSKFEGKPLVMLEALARGVPIFAVDLPSLKLEFQSYGVIFCRDEEEFVKNLTAWRFERLETDFEQAKNWARAHNEKALNEWRKLLG